MHNVLQWSVNLASEHSEYARECLDYSKADFDGIRSQLRDIDWDYELTGTVQNSWDIFKAKLHELERRYIPKKQGTLAKRKKSLWMTRKAMKLVEKKHRIFRKHKDASHPAYVKASKMASSEVKRAKCNFERKITRNIEIDVKSFYAYVRQKSCSRPRVDPLKNGTGQVVSEACHMVEIFNDLFSSVFTKEDCTSLPHVVEMPCETGVLNGVVINESDVLTRLQKLRHDKAPGTDDLYPRFFKEISAEISKPLTLIMERSLDENVVRNLPVGRWTTTAIS